MLPEQLRLVNSCSFTVLDELVMNWPSQVTDLLLASMRPEDISRCNVGGRTVLHLAVMNKRDEAVPLLLARMKTKDTWAVWKEPKRQTALHMAAGANFPEIVGALLARGEPSILPSETKQAR